VPIGQQDRPERQVGEPASDRPRLARFQPGRDSIAGRNDAGRTDVIDLARRRTWKLLVPVALAGLAIAIAGMLPASADDEEDLTMRPESEITDCLEGTSGGGVQMSSRCTYDYIQLWRPVALSARDLRTYQRPFDDFPDGYVRFWNQETGTCLALVDNSRAVGTLPCRSAGARTVWAHIGEFRGAFNVRNVAAFDLGLPTRLSVEDNGRDVALTFNLVGERSIWHLGWPA
jgi:Cytolethal distending toxin A/C domain